MARRWTPEEETYLINCRNSNIPYEHIKLEGRTLASMKTKTRDLIKAGRINNCHAEYKPWTVSEDEILISGKVSGLSYVELEKLLNRSNSSVTKRLAALNRQGKIKLSDRKNSAHGVAPPKERVQYSEDYLLNLVRKYKTQDNLNHNREEGEPSSGPIVRMFGSWSEALIRAGMELNTGAFHKGPTTLYLIEFDEFYKIGLTQRSVAERLRGFPKYIILDEVILDFDEAWQLERDILNWMKPYKVVGNLPNGNEECFIYPVVDICTLVEEFS